MGLSADGRRHAYRLPAHAFPPRQITADWRRVFIVAGLGWSGQTRMQRLLDRTRNPPARPKHCPHGGRHVHRPSHESDGHDRPSGVT